MAAVKRVTKFHIFLIPKIRKKAIFDHGVISEKKNYNLHFSKFDSISVMIMRADTDARICIASCVYILQLSRANSTIC